MNREELKERIELLKLSVIESEHEIKRYTISKKENEEELEKLEKQLEKKPPLALWKPNLWEKYYLIGPINPITYWNWKDNGDDHAAFELGNTSPTEKLAELKRDIRLATEEYKRKVAEFNEDWEADWGDVPQRKYYLHVVSYYTFIPHIRLKPTYTSAYCAEKEGFYFSWYVANNGQQVSKLKELYQKIIDLTKEYKKAEKEWRNEE